jgi:proteasome accessory factor C
MPDTATIQLRRLLHLVLMVSEGEHPIDELACELGVSPDQLIADLTTLVERYDTPGGFIEGVQVYLSDSGVSVFSDHFRRPMRLTIAELSSLELGLNIYSITCPATKRGAVDRALERLRAVITKLPANDHVGRLRAAELGYTGSAEHLAEIREAIRSARKIELTYRGGGQTHVTQRLICPYRTVFAMGAWYIIAYCEHAKDIRFFRLDRIEAIHLTDQSFKPPASETINKFIADGRLLRTDDVGTVTVKYSPRIARWIAERLGKTIEDGKPLVVEHPLADLDWAIRHILQYGPDAEVIAPQSVREVIRERLQTMMCSS